MLAAQRWPTWIPEADFKRVTNAPAFPPSLAGSVKEGRLEYYCNTLVSYAIKGVHTTLNIIWDWEAPAGGGDTHFAYYRGTKARVEIRQTKADKYLPELYVIPASAEARAAVLAAATAKVASLATQFPGIGIEDRGAEIRVIVPAALRVGHEAHFAQVTANFLDYLGKRGHLPAWERPNMLAKYYVSTAGAELSRKSPPQEAPRKAPR